MIGCLNNGIATGSIGVDYVQIPFLFWFCRNPGLALPLIALQYHEVQLNFTFGQVLELMQMLMLNVIIST